MEWLAATIADDLFGYLGKVLLHDLFFFSFVSYDLLFVAILLVQMHCGLASKLPKDDFALFVELCVG